jgi:hypothetical protein
MSSHVNARVSTTVKNASRLPSEQDDHSGQRADKPSRSPQQRRFITPKRVLDCFNTRAFKREQPDNPELMLEVIARSMARNEPIPFILYWGKGPRSRPAEPESKTLDYLAALARRVRDTYEQGAALTVIFTDTHAELNGHSLEAIRSYFHETADWARQRGFESCWLSDVKRRVQWKPDEGFADQDVPKELLSTLCASATKWFRGSGTAEEGARRYYQSNMIEKRVVELAYPHSIFVTFNGSELRPLFPSGLPVFYMFSLRHGVSDKPWFLPAVLPSRNTASSVHQLACNT